MTCSRPLYEVEETGIVSLEEHCCQMHGMSAIQASGPISTFVIPAHCQHCIILDIVHGGDWVRSHPICLLYGDNDHGY
jgi:hypothetical protein